MMVSRFTFYRGTALPIGSDLAATAVLGLAVQARGGAHLPDFGILGSAERCVVFGQLTDRTRLRPCTGSTSRTASM
jgi:Uncharacterized protein conserved in bacteria (DUF2252)